MYIAIDIGGTNIRVAFAKATRNLSPELIRRHVNIPVSNDYNGALGQIVAAIGKIRGDEREGLTAVGVGIPSVMDDDKTISLTPNLPGWNGRNLRNDLAEALQCSVYAENDDTVAAFGEAAYGYGQAKDFVYITWGTGLGAAQVTHSQGKIAVHQFEAGHQIIEWSNGRCCGCGQLGCAEAYIGGGCIQRHYTKSALELSSVEWDEIIDHFSQALLNVVVMYPTKLIVIGGGIGCNQRPRLPEISAKLHDRLKMYAVPELRVTELGDDIGLYGAFALLANR